MSLAEPDSAIGSKIEGLLQRLRPRANSLIVTVFGDAIMPRGGTIWLSDLVHLMGTLGLSERLVRTGVYRLSQEGWLTSLSVGRRAQYSLTEIGLNQFTAAGRRIYASKPEPSSDIWTLVQGVPEITQTERQALRRRLKWHGFGQFSTTLMACPGAVPSALANELRS
ncbi:MAG: phenylacetic acid degradation operon negative regulatory protein PaaX, partial [Rhizobiales bacterium]|nr:phenylacetic acid degradation operon negative regulatory protein PaaX [Hyphomicrobiales bacterium]